MNDIKTYQELQEENRALTQKIKNIVEEQLTQESKDSINKLIPDIIHEINNPINIVSGYTSIMRRNKASIINLISLYQDLEKRDVNYEEKVREIEVFKAQIDLELTKEELDRAVNAIELAFKRIKEISNNLTLIGKQTKLAVIKLDVNKCIEETLLLVKKEVEDQIEIKIDLENLPEIKSYPGKLNQVFLNMIRNSIEAIREKEELLNEFISITTTVDDEYVIVMIEDSGIGMTAEMKENIYERFFLQKTKA